MIEKFKSQFKTDEDGKLYISATAKAKTAAGVDTTLETGTLDYTTSNEAVATTGEDPNDETKVKIYWVGPGDVQIQAKGDADRDAGEAREVSGVLDLKFSEDEADSIELTLDEDVPAVI